MSNLKNSVNDLAICYGTFDMLHPGHFRILNHALKLTSKLIVVISDDNYKNKHKKQDRLQMIKSLNIAHEVLCVGEQDLREISEELRPKYLVVGEEFRELRNSEIRLAEESIKKNGGEVSYYFNNEHEYLNVNNDFNVHNIINFESVLNFQKEYGLDKNILETIMQKFSELRVCVIGDAILDNYVQSAPLGISSEAPVMVVNQQSEQKFSGGAAVVAKHISALRSKSHLISVVGSDPEAETILEEMKKARVTFKNFSEEGRPTTLKTRYLVGEQKVFRVSRLIDKQIEEATKEKILNYLEANFTKFDRFIFSDFSYGLLSDNLMKTFSKKFSNYFDRISGDSQSGSQRGNLEQFSNFNCIFPTENEARIDISDKVCSIEMLGWKLIEKLNNNHVFMKLGKDGLLVFNKKDRNKIYCPSFANSVVDVSGAGDALLSLASLSLSINKDPKYAAFLGSVASAFAVNNLGNLSVKKQQLLRVLKELR